MQKQKGNVILVSASDNEAVTDLYIMEHSLLKVIEINESYILCLTDSVLH